MAWHYTVYCSDKLDGLAAAAILLRAFRLRNIHAKIGGFLQYGDVNVFDQITEQKNALLFILDFSPEEITEHQLQAITANNRIAYWNSHHPYSKEQQEMVQKHIKILDLSGQLKDSIVFEQKKCAAELVMQKFLPHDHVATELSALAHDSEFWLRKDPRAGQLADLINSGFDKKHIIDALSKGVLWSEHFERQRIDYLNKKQKAMDNLLRRLMIKNYLHLAFGFVLAPPLLGSSEAGQWMLDKHNGFDVAVVVFRDGKVSFRKRENIDFDLEPLGKLFGGGGHDYASSGQLSKNVTYENFEDVVYMMDRKLKDHLLR